MCNSSLASRRRETRRGALRLILAMLAVCSGFAAQAAAQPVASENRLSRLAAFQAGVQASPDSAAENLSIAGWDGRIFGGAARDVDCEGCRLPGRVVALHDTRFELVG